MEMKVHESIIDQAAEPQAMSAIRQVTDGYKSFQALLAGFRSGLFDWLAQNGPAARPDIATALNLRGAHLAFFLQALEDLGALSRQDGTNYVLAEGMDQVLCKGNPWYQGAVLEEMLAESNGWSAMDRFMSTAWITEPTRKPVLAPQQHPFFGEAERLADYLGQRLKSGETQRVLCFDGGEAQFALALCRRFPDVVVTAVVAETELEQARVAVAESGFSSRCSVQPGSALTPPEGEYDFVVLFHALYPLRRNTNDVLAAVAERLAPQGELLCAHWFCLEACDTAPGGLRDLDRAVLTDSHPMCHVETFCERFDKIGMVDADRTDLHGEYGVTKLHFARKPAASQE